MAFRKRLFSASHSAPEASHVLFSTESKVSFLKLKIHFKTGKFSLTS
jgi:hypothetical protein